MTVPYKATKQDWTWRLNDNLLKAALCTTEIGQAISHFISDQQQDDTLIPTHAPCLKKKKKSISNSESVVLDKVS